MVILGSGDMKGNELPCTVQETVAYRGRSVMVWEGISLNQKSDLVFIHGGLTAVRYIQGFWRLMYYPLQKLLGKISH